MGVPPASRHQARRSDARVEGRDAPVLVRKTRPRRAAPFDTAQGAPSNVERRGLRWASPDGVGSAESLMPARSARSGALAPSSPSPSPRRSSRRLTRGSTVASTSATSAAVSGGAGQKRTLAPSLANTPLITSACTWTFPTDRGHSPRSGSERSRRPGTRIAETRETPASAKASAWHAGARRAKAANSVPISTMGAARGPCSRSASLLS